MDSREEPSMSTPIWFLWVQTGASVAIFLTFLVYLRLLAAMKKGTGAQNAIFLIQVLQRSDTREARRRLLELEKSPYGEWSNEDKAFASDAINPYEIAGILIRQKLVEEDLIVRNWRVSILKSFNAAGPLIHEARTAWDPRYWKNFEWLAGKAAQMRLEDPLGG